MLYNQWSGEIKIYYLLLLLLLLLPGGHADPELEPGHNGGTVPEGEGSPRLHRLLQQFMPETHSSSCLRQTAVHA
jgi:hypothetical protein